MRNLFFVIALLTLGCWSTVAVAQDVDCSELCQCCECEDGDVECLEDCDCARDCECADLANAQEEEYFEEPTRVVYVSYWPEVFLGAYIYYNSVPYYWYGGYYHRYHVYYHGGRPYWVHHHYWRHHRPHHGYSHPARWGGGRGHGKAHGKAHGVKSAKPARNATHSVAGGGKGQSWNHKAHPKHKGRAQVQSPKSKVKSPKHKGRKQAPVIHAGVQKGRKQAPVIHAGVPNSRKQIHAGVHKSRKAATVVRAKGHSQPVQKNHKPQSSSYRSVGKGGGSKPAYRSSGRGGGSKPAYRASSRGGSRPANRSGRSSGRGRGRR